MNYLDRIADQRIADRLAKLPASGRLASVVIKPGKLEVHLFDQDPSWVKRVKDEFDKGQVEVILVERP